MLLSIERFSNTGHKSNEEVMQIENVSLNYGDPGEFSLSRKGGDIRMKEEAGGKIRMLLNEDLVHTSTQW